MCKFNLCLIISNLMTTELECPMIFLSCILNPHYKVSASKRINFVFATVRSPCISFSKLKMLTFYFNILVKTKFFNY